MSQVEDSLQDELVFAEEATCESLEDEMPKKLEKGDSRSSKRSTSRSHSNGDDGNSSRKSSRSRSSSTENRTNKKRSCRDRSRSKSRSRSRSNGRRRRSRSRSPTRKRVVSSTIHQLDHRNVRNDRRSQAFDRERPAENRILGVFGLSQLTTERQLRVLFGEFDGLEEVKMVYDAHTGKSRGFAFVYFESIATSKRAKEKFDGLRLDGCRIRVDFSVTDRAHEPTPGMYMGNSWYVQQDGSKYCPDRLLNAKRNRGPSNGYNRSGFDDRRSRYYRFSSQNDRRRRSHSRSRSPRM